jgi:hypothetical protein
MMTSNPDADRAIENRRPLKELAPLFSSRVEACEYYAERATQRFFTAGPQCAHCDHPTDTEPLSFVWRANVHTAKTVAFSFFFTAIALLGHTIIVTKCIPVGFATQHRLCPRCRRNYRLRRFAAGFLHYVFFALLIAALLVTVPAVIMLFVAIFYAHEMLLATLAASVAGVVVLALITAGFELLRRWPIPTPLRRVGQFPFALEKVR